MKNEMWNIDSRMNDRQSVINVPRWQVHSNFSLPADALAGERPPSLVKLSTIVHVFQLRSVNGSDVSSLC